MFNLKNKNILITGASSGIGKATAVLCDKLGANLLLIARREKKLIELMNSLNGGKHRYLIQDINNLENIVPYLQDFVSKTGAFDGVVNAAGIDLLIPFKMQKLSKIKGLFDINVFAGIELSRLCIKHKLYTKQSSSFVFISSVVSHKGEKSRVAYAASKGAIEAAVKSLSREFANENIRVNSISPGIVKTEMVDSLFKTISGEAKDEIINQHPLGIGTPEDIGNLIAFLVSDKSRWITGSNIIIDGGYSA